MSARGGSAQPGEGPVRPPHPSAAEAETAGEAGVAASTAPGPAPRETVSRASPAGAARETVLGNCARCGSGDRLKFCSRCNAIRYCSPDCQKDDVSTPYNSRDDRDKYGGFFGEGGLGGPPIVFPPSVKRSACAEGA